MPKPIKRRYTKEIGKVYQSTTFQIGDIICSKKNMDFGMPFFFKANDYDKENYSGRNLIYYIVILNQTLNHGTANKVRTVRRMVQQGNM